jgi:hypothetical protein
VMKTICGDLKEDSHTVNMAQKNRERTISWNAALFTRNLWKNEDDS